jgi:hypothetical protein
VDSLNPYAAQTAVVYPHGPQSRTASPQARFARFLHFFMHPSVLLSVFGVIHFGASLLFWLVGSVFVLRIGPNSWGRLDFLWGATPALLLFAASVANLIRSIRRARFVLIAVVAIYIISACLFWYDVSNEHCQMQVGIAPAEYWENGGQANTYFTWWWFNDGWFR